MADRPLKICLLCYRGNPYSGGQGIYLKYIADVIGRVTRRIARTREAS